MDFAKTGGSSGSNKLSHNLNIMLLRGYFVPRTFGDGRCRENGAVAEGTTGTIEARRFAPESAITSGSPVVRTNPERVGETQPITTLYLLSKA
jgi:hypothetical protein